MDPSDAKPLIQCDFDGTVTMEDASFVLLDRFADGDWRSLWTQYERGSISVGRFNREAFAMVKADRDAVLKSVMGAIRVRLGLQEFAAFCRRTGIRLVIVSNGLDFYIREILGTRGLDWIESFAALTHFSPDGLQVRYVDPNGDDVDDEFKMAYVHQFLKSGYHVTYIGNGTSDIVPARQCHRVFAIAELLAGCRKEGIACTPFNDFHDVVREIGPLWLK